jgi:hypothetical protein
MNTPTASLADFQDDFLGTLYGAAPAHADVAGLLAQPGFAVYRNTVFKGCVDNLAANFPTVLRLAGEERFRAAAVAYAHAQPPREPALLEYGAWFPDFLAEFAPTAALPWLAGVARLDRLWLEAHSAADAGALDAAALAGLAPAELGGATLHLHPATRWCWWPDLPVAACWDAARRGFAGTPDEDAPGGGILITRPADTVQWQRIDEGTAAFLAACGAGQPLQEAALHALDVQPDLEVAPMLAGLLGAGAFLNCIPEE